LASLAIDPARRLAVAGELLEALPHGVGVVQEGRVRQPNAALARLLGEASPGQLEGQPLRRYLSSDSWSRWQLHGQELLAGGPTVEGLSLQVVGRERRPHSVRFSLLALRFAGRPAILVVAQAPLLAMRGEPPRSLHSRLVRTLLTDAPVGVLVLDGRAQVKLANPAVTRLTGIPAQALLQSPDWLALLWPDAQRRSELAVRMRNDIRRYGASTQRLTFAAASGEPRELRLHAAPLPDAGDTGAGLLVLLDDLSPPMLLGEHARQALDLLPLPVALLDVQGRPVYGNAAFWNAFGGHADEALLPQRPAQDEPRWREWGLGDWVRKILSTPAREVLSGPTVSVPDGQGSTLRVRSQAAPLWRGDRFAGLLLYGEGRAEHEVLEAQLRQANKMRTLGTLALGLAHDQSNTVSAILGFGTTLAEGMGPASPFYQDVQAILSLARQAAEITRQLMGLGQHGSATEAVQINELVQHTLSLLRRSVPANILVRFEPDGQLRPAVGAAGPIQQCLLNLCLNACEAMPEGGLLTVRTSNLSLPDESGSADAVQEVLLEVSDSGEGIAPGDLPNIFEPFFSTKGRGSGLGLSMVNRIVESYGGTVGISSALGQGTQVDIRLPVAAAAPEQPRTVPEGPAPGGSETILVVDGAPGWRGAVEKVLRRRGYRALGAATADDARQIIARRPGEIDLLLLELVLPGGGAVELFEELRAWDPALRIVLCSAHRQEEVVERLLGMGAGGFLPKPTEPGSLLRLLRFCLDDTSAGVGG